MANLRLIVGLGNPGAEYSGTRHNVGFAFVDALAAQAGERFGIESRLFGETARLRIGDDDVRLPRPATRSEEHTSELQSLMRISYAVFCLKKKNTQTHNYAYNHHQHISKI